MMRAIQTLQLIAAVIVCGACVAVIVTIAVVLTVPVELIKRVMQ